MDMVKGFQPGWRPFALAGLPHGSAAEAWRVIRRNMVEIPHWPQLPHVSADEGLYAQWGEGFPGISMEGDSPRVLRNKDLDSSLEQLYMAYLEDELDCCAVGPEHASGLHALLAGHVRLPDNIWMLKGQIMGPVSWALGIVDQNRRSLLYDQILGDAAAKHLRLKAAWQERELRRFCGRTLIMVQEPYLSSLGSSLVSITRHQIISLLEETLSGLQGLKGIHVCGDADWTVLTDTSMDVLSLDAYDYGEALGTHAPQVNAFLGRGGAIAWGIVPASSISLDQTAESLADRLDGLLEWLASKGIEMSRLLSRGFVTPACTLSALDTDLAEHVMRLTTAVSHEMRERHPQASAKVTSTFR